MEPGTQAAYQLGRRVKDELDQIGQTQNWLARQVGRNPSAISKLINGSWVEQGGIGSPLVREVERVLGFADGELVRLHQAALGEQQFGGDPERAPRVELHAPREHLSWSLLLDARLRRLRCFLVDPANARDDSLSKEVRKALAGAGAAIVDAGLPWDVHEGDEEDEQRHLQFARDCERAEDCDLAILLVSQQHAERCEFRRSTIEAFLQEFAARNLPSLVYASRGAADYAHRLKARKGFERNVVDRLYRFEPRRGEPLTYVRIAETSSNGALIHDLLTSISSLASAALSNIRVMSQVTWNDVQLTELESSATDVWVLTPDFYYELEDATWRDVLVQTIGRGGRYRYLFPLGMVERARRLYERVSRLLDRSAATERIDFFAVPDGAYPWWPQMAIYNADDPDRTEAFLYDLWDRELPLSCNYNYRLSDQQVRRLVAEFRGACTEDRRRRFGG